MKKVYYSKELLEEIVQKNKSIAGVLRDLNLRPIGGNYRTVKRFIAEYNIDTSHFTGQGWNVGLKFKPQKKFSDEEVFIESSKYRCSWRLRNRLLEIRKEHKCDCCGLSEWMGRPISLEIHHINGINTDNRLENLQILCPNCHAQTNNYRGKHKLSALSEKREVEYCKFKEALTGNADGNLEPSLE